MKNCCKLSIMSLALALGIGGALTMFGLGILAWQMGWGTPIVELLASFHVGYAATLKGSLVGAVWGFAHWFVGGFVIALLYNCILCCGRCSKVCKSSEACDSEQHQ